MATASTPFKLRRLQHVVLQVSDVERSIRFYQEVLGLELNRRRPNGAAFLRIPGSGNDHDLALFPKEGIGPASGDTAGLVHVAWEVDDVRELARARAVLVERGLLTAETNHGMSLSVYGRDPDGLEFEVFCSSGEPVGENVPLNLAEELAKRGIATTTA